MMDDDIHDYQKDHEKRFQNDLLLNALLILAKLKKKACSPFALIAGLPLVNDRLTPELFIRAAKRIDLSARLVKQKLKRITKHNLPCLLFLENGCVWILTTILNNKKVEVIQTESGEGKIVLPLKELEDLYTGCVMFVQEEYHFDKDDYKFIQKPKRKNWLWSAMRRVIPVYGEVLVSAGLINLFALVSPLFIMNVYDRVVPNNAIVTLWVLAIGAMIVFGFEFLLRNLRSFFIDLAGKNVDIKISSDIFEQIMGIEAASRTGSIGSFVNTVQSFNAFREFMASFTIGLLIDVPFVILFIAVIWFIAGSVALVPVIAIPIMLLVSYLIQKPLTRTIAKNYSYSAASHNVLIESLSGIETIKAFCAEGAVQHQWELIKEMAARLSIKLRILTNIGINFSTLIQHLVTIFVVIVGVYRIAGGNMTVGALIACVILSGRTIAPIARMALLLTQYQETKTAVNSINQIMNMPVERSRDKKFIHNEKLSGDIAFKNVSFTYSEDAPLALDDVSFHIRSGERVGFIGKIGSGKTTIAKMMLKFYPSRKGTILVDGNEIHQIDPAELRYYIGYIPQDVVLFHGTIRDNIAFGAPYVSDSAILRAAKLGGVDTFVEPDINGFNRKVSERGGNLSGGQRQTIAIARALLTDPPVLIIDEPCNSMDDMLIRRIINRLNEESKKNKTIILSTHRAPLLQLVDRLIVLDQGKVVADGPKDEILKRFAENEIKTAALQNLSN